MFVFVRVVGKRMLVFMRMLVQVRLLGGFCGLTMDENLKSGGENSASIDFFEAKNSIELQRGNSLREDFEGDTRIDGSSNEHISGDTGEAFQKCNSHDQEISGCAEAIAAAGRTAFIDPER
jgi:hypothetical protein